MADHFTLLDMDLASIRRYLDPTDPEREKLRQFATRAAKVRISLVGRNGDRAETVAAAKNLAAICRDLGASDVEIDESGFED